MRAVSLVNGKPELLIATKIPNPNKGQVLVKVAYSTVNSFDKWALSNIKTEGQIFG
jgi:NADPH:quinone reductase-like Zn-dependent oxidoreductase